MKKLIIGVPAEEVPINHFAMELMRGLPLNLWNLLLRKMRQLICVHASILATLHTVMERTINLKKNKTIIPVIWQSNKRVEK